MELAKKYWSYSLSDAKLHIRTKAQVIIWGVFTCVCKKLEQGE